EANEYCLMLFKNGLLVPEQKKPTFAEFSAGWWDIETCRYLKWRELHEPITDSTLIIYQANFRNHIKDYFAKYKLDEITPLVIENWLLFMRDKGVMRNESKRKKKNENEDKPKKLLKAKTINLALFTLKIMLGEAVKQKLLQFNPCDEVKELKKEATVRVILTADEVKKLFPVDWSLVWENEIVYKANLLAACTGLRIGELRGLRGDMVFDNYIHVQGQYLGKKYIEHTKTKENRTIPVSPVMRKLLDDLLAKNGNGYVFSDDGGKTPVSNNWLNRGLNRALKKIGISHEEKLKRNLSFHAWRHFLNTVLLTSNVGLSKVQKVTGHKSLKMTDHYTHFDTKQFTEVVDVQNNLLAFNIPENQIIQAEVIQTEVKTPA
ncbi:MAG: site-specific integrase, partial [Treponema sp.]|nr:site-specific integrase [Treponema sp.]